LQFDNTNSKVLLNIGWQLYKLRLKGATLCDIDEDELPGPQQQLFHRSLSKYVFSYGDKREKLRNDTFLIDYVESLVESWARIMRSFIRGGGVTARPEGLTIWVKENRRELMEWKNSIGKLIWNLIERVHGSKSAAKFRKVSILNEKSVPAFLEEAVRQAAKLGE
jgi:hypothetical protein